MNVAFAGGGTGGHLFPGLALAEELRRRDPAGRLLFLCTERDGAYGALDEPWLEVAVLPGSHRGALPRRLASLVPATGGAMRALRRFRPHVVVGLGGYGSVAAVMCARVLGAPSLLLEQNVVPGRANRLLSRVASEVASQWAESVRHFGPRHKVRVTGNPIRSRVARGDRAAAAAELGLEPAASTLLVMGGSQGATPLNNLVVDALPDLARRGLPAQCIHLAGRADCERVRAAYERHGVRARVLSFLGDMSLAYSACDLALSRAGGTSIAELTALGVPSILIPLPHAADNHQHLNARVLEYGGAALLLEQRALTPQRLAHHVAELLGDKLWLAHMACRSRQFGVPNAASVVADRVAALAKGRRGTPRWPGRPRAGDERRVPAGCS